MESKLAEHCKVLFTADRPFFVPNEPAHRGFSPFETCTDLDDGLGAAFPKDKNKKKEKANRSITVEEDSTIQLYVLLKARMPIIDIRCVQSLVKGKKAVATTTTDVGNLRAPNCQLIQLPPMRIAKKYTKEKQLHLSLKLVDESGKPFVDVLRCVTVRRDVEAELMGHATTSTDSQSDIAEREQKKLAKKTFLTGPIILFQEQRDTPLNCAAVEGCTKIDAQWEEGPGQEWKPNERLRGATNIERSASQNGELDGECSAKPLFWCLSMMIATKDSGDVKDAPSLMLCAREQCEVFRRKVYTRSRAHGAPSVSLWRFDISVKMCGMEQLMPYKVSCGSKHLSDGKYMFVVPPVGRSPSVAFSTLLSPFGAYQDVSNADPVLSVSERVLENEYACMARLYARHIQDGFHLQMVDVSPLFTSTHDAHEVIRRMYPVVECARLRGILGDGESDWRRATTADRAEFEGNCWYKEFYGHLQFSQKQKDILEAHTFDVMLNRFLDPRVQQLFATVPAVPHLPLDVNLIPCNPRHTMLEVQLKFLAMFLLGKELGNGRAINTRLDALEKLCLPHLDVFDANMLQDLRDNTRDTLKCEARGSAGFLSFVAKEDSNMSAIKDFTNHEVMLFQLRRRCPSSDMVVSEESGPVPASNIPVDGAVLLGNVCTPISDTDFEKAKSGTAVVAGTSPGRVARIERHLHYIRALARFVLAGGTAELSTCFAALLLGPEDDPFVIQTMRRVLHDEYDGPSVVLEMEKMSLLCAEVPDESGDMDATSFECDTPMAFEEDDDDSASSPVDEGDDRLGEEVGTEASSSEGKSEGGKGPNGVVDEDSGEGGGLPEANVGEEHGSNACNGGDFEASEDVSRSDVSEGVEDEQVRRASCTSAPESSVVEHDFGDVPLEKQRSSTSVEVGEREKKARRSTSLLRLVSRTVSKSKRSPRSGSMSPRPDGASMLKSSSEVLPSFAALEGEGDGAISRSSMHSRSNVEHTMSRVSWIPSSDVRDLPPAPTLELSRGNLYWPLPYKNRFLYRRAEESVWQEAESGSWNVVFGVGGAERYDVRAGTLAKLVETLTTPSLKDLSNLDDYESFMSVFFMTYRAFADPKDVMKLIIQRYRAPGWASSDLVQSRLTTPISRVQFAVCKALMHWFTEHYQDFTSDPDLLLLLKKFIKEEAALADSDEGKGEASSIMALKGKVSKKEKKGTYESMYDPSVIVENPPDPILPPSLEGVTFMMLDDLEIARQLTIAEFHIYVQIKPVEMQNLAWSKPKLKHTAPNILHLINHFNTFSMQCVTMIVNAATLRERRAVIMKLVNIAHELLELRSFNMAMAIKAAFNHASIHRLKYSFQALPKATVRMATRLHTLLSTENNNAAIRETVNAASPPCIPFLGIYLSDLTFVEDGNPDHILGGLINFRKRELEYAVIKQILAFKDRTYSLKLVPRITKLMEGLEVLDEKDVRKRSLELEPRKAQKKDIK